ncbi:MAG: alpha/beta hydrolase [Myxococcales bacterium]|nr:alpha/beta hydrolase [Myxococcales bacterium]
MSAAWCLLGLGCLSLLLSLNARFPVQRFGSLSLVSFFGGWLTTELALHHLFVQLGLAGALVYLGALTDFSPHGYAGAFLLVISWAQLVRLHRRAALAELALDTALAKLRGERDPGRQVRFGEVLRPFSLRHKEVRVERREYAEHGGKKLYAHVYFRRDQPRNAPVLVFAHGGGWVVGFKRFQALPMLNQLAAQGWVCVSLDYRLAPRATFPDPLIDVKRGIAWTKRHVEEFGGDPSFVGLSGNSAGAHLAALAALTWDKPELQPGFEDEDTRVSACIPFYGVFDLLNSKGQWRHSGMQNLMRFVVIKQSLAKARDQYELMSPITHVRADAPPFFVIHGDVDSLVPTSESRHFCEALERVSSAPVLYAEIPDAQHAFEIFKSIRGVYTVRAAAEFLEFVRSEQNTLRQGVRAA